MNYQKIYDEIIERAKLRGLNKKLLEGYFEKHHIVPKCLGGLNNINNLVLLTAREHYLCHHLLTKLYKLYNAIWFSYHNMIYCKNKLHKRHKAKLTSKQYEILRIVHSNNLKRKRSITERTNISKGKLNSDYIMPEDVKIKISNSKKGLIPWNKGLKGKQVAWNKDKTFMKGGSNPKAVSCKINGIEYSCKKDAMKALNISNMYRLNKLLR